MADDDVDISDLSFDDKVAFLEGELPKPVQDFLHSPERDAVSLRLSQKYGLHADQAGIFEKAYLYMLLGVNSPDEFVQDLKDGGLAPDTINGLTNDVNEQVFKRLREQERTSVQSTPVRAPAPAAVPAMQVLPTPPAAAAPIQVPVQAPETPAYNLIRPSEPAAVSAPLPQVRTMRSDIEALQHPERQIVPTAVTPQGSMPVIPDPAHVTPARSFQTASVPYTSAPVASNPSPIYSVPSMPIAPRLPNVAPTPINPIVAQAPTASAPHDHDSDPYREPLS